MPKKTYRRRRVQRTWDEWYKLAKDYYEGHGDLLVPMAYRCPGGQRLGRWIDRQRAKYNDVPSNTGYLYPEQIALLEDIGMVWKLEYRHPWKAWLKKLEWYKDVYGDLNVPGDFEDHTFHLGNWIIEQRKKRHAGLLSEQQIADLDNLGMLWNVALRPRTWDEWYADAFHYFEEHGDLQVPVKYETEEGYSLGNWIYTQCRIRKDESDKGTLTQSQIDKLDAIHIVWDREAGNKSSWNLMYDWVCEYLETNGKLPVWPLDLKAPDGRSMPGWISVQRSALTKGNVSVERREKLEGLGILPFQRQEAKADLQTASWDEIYEWTAEYIKLNGEIPKSIKNIGESILPENSGNITKAEKRFIVNWLRQQKRLLEEGDLSEERIQKLAGIGISVPPLGVKAQAWETMYRWVENYVREHKKLPVSPKSLTADDGRNVPSWISNQRKAIEQEYILPERKERLEVIGIVPIKRRAVQDSERWEEMYEWIAQYVMIHGKLPVQGKPEREIGLSMMPAEVSKDALGDIGCPPGGRARVAKWIKYQELCLANGSVSEDRRERLALIGVFPSTPKSHDDSWNEMYEWVVQYKEEHGKLPLSPKTLKALDGRLVPEWIQYQRSALADGKLSAEQVDKLTRIGIKSATRRPKNESWESMYRWVEAYVKQNGSLPGKSRAIRSEDGRCVPDWIRNQEKLISAGKMSDDRRQRLERLGIGLSKQGG